jgi:hypothetical protein
MLCRLQTVLTCQPISAVRKTRLLTSMVPLEELAAKLQEHVTTHLGTLMHGYQGNRLFGILSVQVEREEEPESSLKSQRHKQSKKFSSLPMMKQLSSDSPTCTKDSQCPPGETGPNDSAGSSPLPE